MYKFDNVRESDYTWSTISGAEINLAAIGVGKREMGLF